MTLHQRFNQPAYEFHPELGYLCPSRQLRQNVRVGLAAAAFGLITGAAATMALLPRHAGDLTRTEPALAMEAVDPVRDSPPTTSSSSTVGAPSGTAVWASTGGGVKQQPSAEPSSPGAISAGGAAKPERAETPAAPAVTTDRGTATASASEPVRAVPSKRTRTAHSTARRRGREPAPADAFASSPFGLQTGRFADETRSGRRRDWDGFWRW